MTFHLLTPIVQAVFCLVLMAVVLVRDIRSSIHRLFALFLLSQVLWGIIIFGMRSSLSVEQAYLWEKWLVPLGPLASILFFHFVEQYTQSKVKGWLLTLFYGVCIISIPLVANDLLLAGMQQKPYGYAPILKPGMGLLILFTYGVYIMSLLQLFRSYRLSLDADERNRIAYVVGGIIVMLVGVVFDILPILGLPLYPGLVIGNIIFCSLTTVAIIRHSLLDIHIVLRKSVTYALTSALVAIPLVSIYAFVTKFVARGDLPIWGNLILILLLGFLLPQLWRKAQDWVDRWFYRARYNYMKALDTFAYSTQSLNDSRELTSSLVDLINGALRPASVFLLQPPLSKGDFITIASSGVNNTTVDITLSSASPLVKWLEHYGTILNYRDLSVIPRLQAVVSKEADLLKSLGIQLIVPVRTPRGQLVALLLLGQKISEQSYTIEDKRLLFTLSNQMAVVFDNLCLYRESRWSEERYRDLYDHAPYAYFGVSVDGHILLNNKTAQRLLGFLTEEFDGKIFTQFFAPESQPKAERLLQRFQERAQANLNEELQMIKKDGSRIWVAVSISPVWDAEGHTIQGRAMVVDITERKLSEEMIRESEAKFRSLAEQSPNMIFINKDGKVVYANIQCEITMGYKREEFYSSDFNYIDLIATEYRGEVKERFNEHMQSKENLPLEYALVTKDGKRIEALLATRLIPYDGGSAILGIITDITKRKESEERERRLQEELHLSSRLASIGELAAGVAHEINNPLTGIMGFSQRLLRKSADEKTKRGLQIIYEEAQRAARVIENLRTFARRTEPKKEWVDINAVLQKSLEMRIYELKIDNVEVVADLTPDLPMIMVDFHQILQVFLNIILNAQQAISEANHGGKIIIKTRKQGDCVRVTFYDNGPGISKGDLDKLFHPFFTTRGDKGGTGLGLSICHGIVTGHSGKIYVKSELGKGTIFFVELPITA